ncbi:MAG: ABC transporter ATP-binding protein [Lachnospiraceae bacterium]|nr:ABC transporter ATP-binding protein [Lachnospiraceae bacterium]
MENIIEIRHLHKSFGAVHAVNDLSFRVKEGELFAFLGVNGAGKSTTIHMLCGQLQKDSGEIVIDGKDQRHEMDAIRASLGVVFQNSVLDKQLSVYDNLKSRAALYGIYGEEFERRFDGLDGLLGLKELRKRTLGKLSGGQRRRVDIARAILHRPKILILDEPTTGLDPQTRQNVWDAVDSLRKNENMTVFLTTHYMEEAADADYVVILDAGRIAAKGTPLDLKNTYTGDFITLYHAKESEVASLEVQYEKLGIMKGKGKVEQAECKNHTGKEDTEGIYRIAVPDTAAATQLILAHPDVFADYEITKGKMDDVFLAVTGRAGQEGEN